MNDICFNNEKANEFLNQRNSENTNDKKWCWENALHKEDADGTDKVQYVFEYKGFPFCGKGGMQMLCGQEKSGKSTIIANLVCAVLMGKCADVECKLPNAKVLLCDTEQEHSEITEIKDYIKNICGEMYSNVRFAIRELRPIEDVEERKTDIWNSIKHFSPDIVIIDCGTDLVEDAVTNERECKAVIRKQMRISTECKCSMLIVVHLAPTTSRPIGHYGGELARRSTDIMSANIVNSLDDDKRKINLLSFEQKRGRRGIEPENIMWCLDDCLKPQIFNGKVAETKRKGK